MTLLPRLVDLFVENGPGIRQLAQPSQMLEVADCDRSRFFRQNRSVEPARASDLPEGTPKTLRKPAILISRRKILDLIGLLPSGGFVGSDQFSDCKGSIPGHATLLVSSLHSRGERHFAAVVHSPVLTASKRGLPRQRPSR